MTAFDRSACAAAFALIACLLLAGGVFAQHDDVDTSRLPVFEANEGPVVRAKGFVLPPDFDQQYRERLHIYEEKRDLPSNFSWVDQGGLTRVQNQNDCGSCWAFAGIAQLESHIKIHYGLDMDLSEQQIIECNPYGADCGGGWASAVYNVAMTYGVIREAAEIYESSNGGACTQAESLPFGFVTGWNYVSNNVTQIKNALLSGPVASAIQTNPNFDDYPAGSCHDDPGSGWTDHLILIVGWDDRACNDNGAWIIKNSWGTGWGDYGYGMVQYGAALIGTSTSQITYNPPPINVQLLAPLAADVMTAGEDVEIRWSTSGAACSTVDVWMSVNGGEYDIPVASGIANSGVHTWTAINESTEGARFLVVANGDTRDGFGFSPEPVQLLGWRTRYVSSAGSDTPPYDSPATAAHSIQDAVAACTGRDTVMVAGDDYLDTILVESTVRIFGGWSPDFSTHNPQLYPTRLKGTNSAMRFMGDAGDFAQVRDFTFYDCIGAMFDTPAPGRHGGAIICSGTSPTIMNCRFENCATYFDASYGTGGAIQVLGGSPQILSCDFVGNRGTLGGAIALFGATGVWIAGNHFESNTNNVLLDDNLGGAIYVQGGDVFIDGNGFIANGNTWKGGAIYAENAQVTLRELTVDGNTAEHAGGGVFVTGGSLTVQGGRYGDNIANVGSGGAVYAESGDLTVCNASIHDNVAGGLGGGLSYTTGAAVTIENNVFHANDDGSGIGGFFLVADGPGLIRNNVVTLNDGGLGGAVGGLVQGYNDVWNNGTDYSGFTAAATDVSFDPGYLDAAAGSFGLGLHSKCLDAGDPDPTCVDFDGSRNDMGAYGGAAPYPVAPSAVVNARTETVATATMLRWDANPELDVASYVIYRTADGLPPFDAGDVYATVAHPTVETVLDGAPGVYRVVALDHMGYVGGYSDPVSTGTTGVNDAPRVLALSRIAPNPFNPRTEIRFDVPKRAHVTMRVHDLRGRTVRTLVNEEMDAGRHNLTWSGRNDRGEGVAAGVYVLRIVSGGESRTAKLILAK